MTEQSGQRAPFTGHWVSNQHSELFVPLTLTRCLCAQAVFENGPPRNLFGASDLSDLIDQWDSAHHRAERAELVGLLQVGGFGACC
jgi:hypothetical protein